MDEFEVSAETTGSRSAIWALWSDPTRWPEYDSGIVWAELDSPFAAGATGRLKPKGAPFKSTISILSADRDQGFVSTGTLPLAQIRFDHSVTDSDDATRRIVHRGQLNGPLSWFWSLVMGKQLREGEQKRSMSLLDLPH